MNNYKSFEYIPHTADTTMIARGKTYEELLQAAVRGMFHAMEPEFAPNASVVKHTIHSSGIDREALLINFLSNCLCTAAINHEAYDRVQCIQLTNTLCDAYVYGKAITRYNRSEIKAVTYHDLSITHVDELLQATITFDI